MVLPNTDYYGYDLDTYALGISFSACRNACLTDSRCKGFGYRLDGKGQCYPKSFLLNGFHMPNTPQIMHIKIPKELKRATDGFKQEVGKGGFGTVYNGVLDDERVVAVKRLDGILQGDAEFWAEVSVIGNINHRNLVKLWGFCADNEHKLLVYEYLENGSLNRLLFSSDGELGLEQRYNIALGTAKGLSYLHEECLEWVLHCDVKPQNILLDDHLEPKVADFGMSKLFKDIHGIRDIQGIGFSKARGTSGYMAPEWMMNLKINAKADVYSYGIVLLELLSGKSASILVSALAKEYNECNQLALCVTEKIREEGLEEVLDPRLLGELDKKKLERLMKVALLCVQDDRSARPAMSKVVELLLENDE
ncbi:unnamed protein product [Prunus brigantina]